MGIIQILEKPDWISFDDIHELLYEAHKNNREKGLNVKTAEMTGVELEAHIGKNGKCFVALDGNKLIGTTSYRIINRNYWCVKDKVVDRILVGILPEYQGQHISTLLFDKILNEAQINGYKYIETRTSENNEIMQAISIKDGYRHIDFLSTKADHFTVVMLKWLDACPYSMSQIDWHYKWRKFIIKLRYKPGRIKRFGI